MGSCVLKGLPLKAPFCNMLALYVRGIASHSINLVYSTFRHYVFAQSSTFGLCSCPRMSHCLTLRLTTKHSHRAIGSAGQYTCGQLPPRITLYGFTVGGRRCYRFICSMTLYGCSYVYTLGLQLASVHWNTASACIRLHLYHCNDTILYTQHCIQRCKEKNVSLLLQTSPCSGSHNIVMHGML